MLVTQANMAPPEQLAAVTGSSSPSPRPVASGIHERNVNPPKMNTGEDESTRLSEEAYEENEELSPPESKRMRLDDGCNNNLNSTLNSASKKEARWACSGDASLVEPEILEDMGVSMLEDEEGSCESIKKSQSHECAVSPISLENSRKIKKLVNVELVRHDGAYREPDYDTAKLDRLEQDPFDLEDQGVHSTINNESGYASRVETENFQDGKQSFAKDDSVADSSSYFRLCRRQKRPSIVGEDEFKKLSDEIILSILKWLPKKCLVSSMLVCKRWCQIARDEELWTRLNLAGKVLIGGTLGHIIPRGVQILRLAQAEIADPVFLPNTPRSNEESEIQLFADVLADGYASKIQYLDLSMAVISAEGLAALLFECKHLKKLSLERCTVNEACCEAIAQNADLTVLNLTMSEGLNVRCIEQLTKLKNLTSFNISWCALDSSSVSLLCSSLHRSVTRLNIAGCRKTITDDDVKELVKLCPDFVELDLSDCTMLTINTVHSLVTLAKLEHLSLSRCYSIPASSHLRLVFMPSLLYLDVFGIMSESVLASLRANSCGTEINKYLFSSVARPTIGVKRTSIWGLRVRD